MIYLVVASENGAVQCFDAETGDKLWVTYIGSPNFPTLSVGVNEGYVSGVNGSDLYLMRLEDGKIIDKRSLNQTPGGGAVVAGNRIFVTNVDGSLVGHNLKNKSDYPWHIRTGGFSPFAPVISLDDSFIAWVAAPEYVFFAKLGEKPQIWNRFQSQDEIACNPTPINNAFIITTTGGSIIKVGLPSADSPVTRDNSMLWRFNSGSPIRQSAYAGGSTIYVTFVDSHMIGLDSETGLPKWDEPKIGIRSVIASSNERVFALTLDQHIDIIDGATGKTIDSILVPPGYYHANFIDDRIYFIGNDGQLVCIHDKAAVEARFHQTVKQATADKPNAAAKPAEKPAEATEESSESDPFGESPFGGDSAGDDAAGGGDAEPAQDDPFGGG
jgi:outer membrane protein assembly factor BamB